MALIRNIINSFLRTESWRIGMEGEIREEDKERGRGVKCKKESKVAKRTGDIKGWQREQIERSMEVVCLCYGPSKQSWVPYRCLVIIIIYETVLSVF